VLKKSFCRHCELKRSNLVFDIRDKLRNLGFKESKNFEIAAPALIMLGQALQKTLLAMTFREFFSNLPNCIQHEEAACDPTV
jgi:hypothetical protein